MLDLRRLRLLVEVRRRGTLVAAAQALSYSPSAVSQQLKQLEQEAGVPLLQPVGRRVQLTPQALLLVDGAERALDALERAEAAVARSGDEVVGTVRVAVFQSVAHAILPGALSLLHRDHPQLRIEVVEREPEEALIDVVARDFDLVIAEQYPGRHRAQHPELDREVLAHDHIRLAFAETAEARALHELEHQAWVMEPRGTAAREWAVERCRDAGFEPDVRFETADLTAHIRLIRAGHAVGMLPDLVWAGDAPALTLKDLGSGARREIFSSTRHAAAERPSVMAVRSALAGAAKKAGTI